MDDKELVNLVKLILSIGAPRKMRLRDERIEDGEFDEEADEQDAMAGWFLEDICTKFFGF